MTAKRIVTGALLLFVAASLGFVVFRKADATGTGAASPAVEANAIPRKLVATYFHGTKRCNTCRAIESMAKEAIETGFPEALMSGVLEWREVNTDEPADDHYYADYGLTGSSLVLVDFRDGRPARFKVLGKVWDLVADRPAFEEYVQGETRSWLEAP